MTTAVAKHETNGTASAYETTLITGDLSKLPPEERLSYYKHVCTSLGLNPLTQPFAYITLNGKLQLYARKDCTEQLRNLHSVSVKIIARELVEDCYIVTSNARMASGREDESIGAVSIMGLKGEARANAMMKAETKSKRRVTLSICGLGMLDETEVETIPNAYRDPDMSLGANSLTPQEQLAARQANPQPRKVYCNQQQQDALRDIAQELGLTNDDKREVVSKFKVRNAASLTPEQCDELILDLCRRRVSQLLTECAFNLDDVRAAAPSVTADLPDELDQEQADAALTALRNFKNRTEA